MRELGKDVNRVMNEENNTKMQSICNSSTTFACERNSKPKFRGCKQRLCDLRRRGKNDKRYACFDRINVIQNNKDDKWYICMVRQDRLIREEKYVEKYIQNPTIILRGSNSKYSKDDIF